MSRPVNLALEKDYVGRYKVPFCRPAVSTSALGYVTQALFGDTTGGGRFMMECHDLLRRAVPTGTPFLTSSCTDALELAALALDLKPGDEVVMPAWTFPSTANAFALRGAIPIFVDVEPGTLNIDPACVEQALTSRTRALVCMHYAGVACDMAALTRICSDHKIALIEDAAQAFDASWCGRPLGGIGDLGAFSFHGSKNVSCGEGGALIVCRDGLLSRTEVAWEKGTNRAGYMRGEADWYQWCDLGSSFLPSDLTAAFLAAQLSQTRSFTKARLTAHDVYARLFEAVGSTDFHCLQVPKYATHNAHIFAVQLNEPRWRESVLAALSAKSIDARTHYQPLHLSPAGRRLGRSVGRLDITEKAAATLIRLPLDTLISVTEQEYVVGTLVDAVKSIDRLR